MSKYITLTQLKIDGDECKKTRLGKVVIKIDSITSFWDVIDKYDVPVKDAITIAINTGHLLTVESTIEKLIEEIDSKDFS